MKKLNKKFSSLNSALAGINKNDIVRVIIEDNKQTRKMIDAFVLSKPKLNPTYLSIKVITYRIIHNGSYFLVSEQREWKIYSNDLPNFRLIEKSVSGKKPDKKLSSAKTEEIIKKIEFGLKRKILTEKEKISVSL